MESIVESPSLEISVIVPVYNEEASLMELCSRIDASLETQFDYEILLIDDGSKDKSFSVMEKLHSVRSNMKIIRHRVNMGKTMAMMTGFRHSKGEIAVLLDADLQDHPEAIPSLVSKLKEGYDFVGGWRHKRKDSFMKHLVSSVFNVITRKLLKVDLHDINCGFKAIRRDYYTKFHLTGDMHRIVPGIVKAMGGKITEIPVPHSPRKYGISSYNLFRYRGILDIVAFIGSHSTRWRPFHVFTELAFLFWIASFSILGIWSVLRLTGNEQLLSIATPICLALSIILGVGGILLPLIGLQTEILLHLVQKKEIYDQFIGDLHPHNKEG